MCVDELAEETLPYFMPLLPWQQKPWEQVKTQVVNDHLPHGLLAGGMAGIGKRVFVWRLVAWLLCQDRQTDGACGRCVSCLWLTAGAHPDLMVLPSSSMPTEQGEPESIKIEEIRAVQEYSHVKGHGLRLIVLDNAETLTLGAANALLKTLEEPRAGVHLLLISDNPAKLLPTIKSRVQTLPLEHIDQTLALQYIKSQLPKDMTNQAAMLLILSDGAVLKAVELPKLAWFGERILWLKTWVALHTGTRAAVVASDYWQGILPFGDFVALTRLMLLDMFRVYLGLPSLHTDVDVANILKNVPPPSLIGIERLINHLDDLAISTHQNVQEKTAYDMLMANLAQFG